MNKIICELYEEFSEGFARATELFYMYRATDSEASHEACAHRAVKEAGLPTTMNRCPIADQLLIHVSTNIPEVQKLAIQNAYEAFLAATV